ncbi:hypothetical protein N7493_003166 [Penicillium malachiteum]|uniref:Uncharacterized protein n=1 Tax=Penicillium malachiteum TaxID=1324776 RepID=A0AAD6MZR8_9EURO|nr:hypothetical protein N7493_003166 [Penicillium malachiteum]
MSSVAELKAMMEKRIAGDRESPSTQPRMVLNKDKVKVYRRDGHQKVRKATSPSIGTRTRKNSASSITSRADHRRLSINTSIACVDADSIGCISISCIHLTYVGTAFAIDYDIRCIDTSSAINYIGISGVNIICCIRISYFKVAFIHTSSPIAISSIHISCIGISCLDITCVDPAPAIGCTNTGAAISYIRFSRVEISSFISSIGIIFVNTSCTDASSIIICTCTCTSCVGTSPSFRCINPTCIDTSSIISCDIGCVDADSIVTCVNSASTLATITELTKSTKWWLEMLMKQCRDEASLTHNTLCNLIRYSKSSEQAGKAVSDFLKTDLWIDSELNYAYLGPYSKTQRRRRSSLKDLVPITGSADKPPDVITKAILDDCTDCFEFICSRLPELDCYGCNRFGWSFVAIAICGHSMKMLQYLFSWNKPAGATTLMMYLSSNARYMAPGLTPLGYMAQQKSADYLDKVLDLWEPRLQMSILEDHTIDDFILPGDKYDLCGFITHDLAVRLAKFGLNLQNTIITGMEPDDHIHTQGATAWHAGACNGPGFLDYLEEHSDLSKISRDENGDIPLVYAVQAEQYDTIRWFKEHDNGYLNLKSITQRMFELFVSINALLSFTSEEGGEVLPPPPFGCGHNPILYTSDVLYWTILLVNLLY